MFDKMKKIVAWQSDGGGFIPAMADILLAKPGASEKKNIKSNHYQPILHVIWFDDSCWSKNKIGACCLRPKKKNCLFLVTWPKFFLG